jgi:outer membrane immunogenic protein
MLLLGALGAAAFMTLPARAADMPMKAPAYQPVVAPIQWAGLYIGLNGGVGWERYDQSITGGNALSQGIVNSGFVPNHLDTRGPGGLVGGTIGYNWQFGNVVVGPEVDFDYSTIRGSDAQQLALGPFSLTTNGSQRTSWLATFRARAGYLVTPSTLLYLTGGGALGHVNSATSVALVTPFAPLNATAAVDQTDTKFGWVIGAGIEQQLRNNWSIKSEYRYVDLGHVNSAANAVVLRTPVSFLVDQKLSYHTWLVGVNYRFGGI